MAKLHKLKDTIFPSNVYLYCGKLKKFKKQLKKKFPDIDFSFIQNSYNGFCINPNEGQTIIIWLPKKPKTIKELSFLNHEILHCVYYILERIEVNLDLNSEEVYAYLTDFISHQCYEKLNLKISY